MTYATLKERHLFLIWLAAAVSGCGGSASGHGTTSSSSAAGTPAFAASGHADAPLDAGGWPRSAVANEANAPGLYLGAGSDAPAVGYLEPGARLELLGPVEGERVPVRTQGPLAAEAYVPLARIAAYVQQPGLLKGAPVAFASGQVVDLLGPGEPGWTRVRAQVPLGPEQVVLGPFEGSYPNEGLGGRFPTHPEPSLQGEPHRLPAGQAVRVYRKPDPNAPVIATLPPADPPHQVTVLKQQAPWSAVRVGRGPYLVGYVQVPVSPAPDASGSAAPEQPRWNTRAAADTVPARLQSHGGTMHRLQAGTTVTFDGRPFAKLQADGYARELARHPNGEVDVFVAVDNGVAVRGLVSAQALRPLSP